MDASTNKKFDPDEAHSNYLIFKNFISRSYKPRTVFDPSDNMISESIIYVMVATMKQIKVRIQKYKLKDKEVAVVDSLPIYVPTVMVVQELLSNLYIKEHFKKICKGENLNNNDKLDETKLNLLAKTLANRTLWDISQDNIFIKEYNEVYYDTNIMTELAGYNYEAKYKIWLTKLRKLIFESNEHWIINQFQYCKTFMFNNSFEVDITTIPEYLVEAVPQLKEMRINYFEEYYSIQDQKLNKNDKDLI